MCWDFRTEYNRRAVDKKATRLAARLFWFHAPTFESELSAWYYETQKASINRSFFIRVIPLGFTVLIFYVVPP